MRNDTDFIEIGKGNQSKVIGHNNTVSELGATALSIVVFAGKGGLVVFFIMAGWLLFSGYSFYWAVGISAALTIPLTMVWIYGLVNLVLHLQRIVSPPQPRETNGRFASYETPYYSMGKRQGTFITAENGENSHYERWGGGGDD